MSPKTFAKLESQKSINKNGKKPKKTTRQSKKLDGRVKWMFDNKPRRKNIGRSTTNRGNTIRAFEEGVEKGDFNTLIIVEENDGVKEKKPSARRKSQNDYLKKIKTKKGIAKKINIIINRTTCEKFRVNYVLEVVAYIILAKEIKNFEIWTPYGVCKMVKYSNQNYIAGDRHTYDFLLEKLNKNDQIREDICKFLLWKVSKNFKINVLEDQIKTIRNINIQLKRFRKKGANKVAAEMCGVLIAEMIRTSGKVVRTAFREWPKDLDDLRSKFVQSEKCGNVQFRKYITNPSSVSKKTRIAMEKNIQGFSDSE